jgi:hypothetical protein
MFDELLLGALDGFARNEMTIKYCVYKGLPAQLFDWLRSMSPGQFGTALSLVHKLLHCGDDEKLREIIDGLTFRVFASVFEDHESSQRARILGCNCMRRLFQIDSTWADNALRLGFVQMIARMVPDATFALKEARIGALCVCERVATTSRSKRMFLINDFIEQLIEMAEIITAEDTLALMKQTLYDLYEMAYEAPEGRAMITPLFVDGILADMLPPIGIFAMDEL